MSDFKVKFTRLGISLGACLGAGGIGSLATRKSLMTWYPQLIKPAFNPPNWIFAPVWTVLFFMMGYSAYLVWQKKETTPGVKSALTVFGIQLALNMSWSFVFFGLQSLFGGLIVISALWSGILITIIKFFRISRIASYLLFPYFLWVSFATLLNLVIWRLNK